MQSDGAVGELGFQQSGNKAGFFGFRDGPAGEMGGDDVKGEEEVWSGVRHGPASIGDLGALQMSDETMGRLGYAGGKFGRAQDFGDSRRRMRSTVCF